MSSYTRMVALFEVELKSRVVKGRFEKHWAPEKRYYLAGSEAEAEQFARKELMKQGLLRIPLHQSKFSIHQQVEILSVRRIT